LAVTWATVWAEFAIRPTPILQLISLLLLVMLLLALPLTAAWILDAWPHCKVRSLIPAVVAGFAGLAGIVAGELGPAIQFRRYLPEMKRTVEELTGNPAFQTNRIYKVAGLEQRHPWANGVYLVEQPAGPKHVEFFFGAGFPVKHTAYLHCPAGTIERGSATAKRWPRRRLVATNWFIVHD
jgi:hypothetical protein